MGTPLLPDPPGDECSSCWGPGNPFGDRPTPEFVLLNFHDLERGDLWVPAADDEVLRQHRLTQTAIPCTWEFSSNGFVITWKLDNFGVTEIIAGTFGFQNIFSGSVVNPCGLVVSNGLTSPIDNIYFNGTAEISFIED